MRALLRVELRQLARHPGRAWLLVALVAVPVAAVSGGGTILRGMAPTAEERRAEAMGRADLVVDAPRGYADVERALALLPPGFRTERVITGMEEVRVPGRVLRASLVAVESAGLGAGGLARGFVAVTAGRAPANAGEVALSPVLLAGLGRRVGDTVTLAYGTARTITGVVVTPEALDAPLVVRTPAIVEARGGERLFVTPAPDSGTVAALRATGLAVSLRAEVQAPDDAIAVAVFLLGSIGFLEAALVIAAAFAVTLRRRQRDIGLLGSVGATRGGIALALILAAAGIGGAGAGLGFVLGNGIALALQPFLDGWTARANGPFDLSLVHAAGGAILGVLTAAGAAALPALRAASLPVRVALGARRPESTPARHWLFAGLALTAIAVALMLLPRSAPLASTGVPAIGGAVLAILGFGAISPWLLDALARRASGLPLPWRLAVRDAGRARTRNGPVVTAILAGMAMSVTLAAIITSVESALSAYPAQYRADQVLLEGAGAEIVARALVADAAVPRAIAIAPLRVAYANGMPIVARLAGVDKSPGQREPWIAIGDTTFLRAVGAESGVDALAAGRVLALDAPPPVAGVGAVLLLTVGRDGTPLDRPALERVPTGRRVVGPAFVLSPAAAERAGFETGPPPRRGLAPWLVRYAAPVDAAVLTRARLAAERVPGTTVDAALVQSAPSRGIYRAVLLLCLLTGLVVVLVASALSAAESDGDVRTLHTVGAAPGVLRAYRAARAGYLALVGCVLAVPAGLVPALRILSNANVDLAFVMPWRDVLLAVLALPAIAYAVAWTFGRGGRVRQRAGAVLLLVLACAPAARAAGAPTPRWETYVGRAVDGRPLAGELGRIRVPESHARADGRTIEIAFVRYRTTHPHPGPPIVFLEGGPGVSGVAGAAHPATHPFVRLLEHADVIGIDQRGTGLSRPNLATPDFAWTLPRNRAPGRDDELAAFRGAATRAVAHWRARGADPAAYDTNESADDVDLVRAAIGADTIVLYGSSYGSHLALAYLRRHPERVARAALAKIEGPDHTWKLPATTQRLLAAAHGRAAADPRVRAMLPDLLGSVRALLARLERAPVTALAYPGPPDEACVTVGAHDLRVALAQELATTRGTAGIPRLLVALEHGEFAPLAALALERRRGSIGSAMALFMDCASGASPERRARIARESADPANLLGDGLAAPFYPEACAACGGGGLDLGEAFRAPVAAAAPVLLVSGALDARTPPSNAEEVRVGLPHATHVVVTATGHDGRELLAPEFRDLLQAFLRGEPVADVTIDLPFRFDAIRRE